MGVTGLWKLIDAAGKPVPVETLENKILAIDVSIWLHQLVKGFQDTTGGAGANAHLLGLFYRICKLLFFRIKPVFVFDGGVPVLKRKTIAARQSNRSKATESLEKIRNDLLQNLLKQHAIGKLLGQNVKIPRGVSGKQDNMFYLPPTSSSSTEQKGNEESSAWDESEDDWSQGEEESEDSSGEFPSPRKKYGDLHSIDVKSEEFKALPADMRHDILSELKETRKQNSWAKVHLMPEDVGDFSSFQMNRLLKRRSVQVGLEEAQKEMGPRCFTVSEIKEILEYQGVDVAPHSQRVASDSASRILYTQKKESDKEKGKKLKTIAESVEDLDSDIDDPLLDALKSNEDMSQEEILKLIKEERTKNKIRDLAECGNLESNPNETASDEIRPQESDRSKPGKIPDGSVTVKRNKVFDDKQVSLLLKGSASKAILPISKMNKVMTGKRKKMQRKRIVKKVNVNGPNLSESSSDSDTSAADGKQESCSDNESHDKKLYESQSHFITSKNDDSKVPKLVQTNPNTKMIDIDSNEICQVKSSGSSDDDFEEVQPDGFNESLTGSLEKSSKITDESVKNRIGSKSVDIKLDFKELASDEEDMFADIFEKEGSTLKKRVVPSLSDLPEKERTVSIELNLTNDSSDEEDIFADVFEVKNPAKSISKSNGGQVTVQESVFSKETKNIGNELNQSKLTSNLDNNNKASDKSSVIDKNQKIISIESTEKQEEIIFTEDSSKAKVESTRIGDSEKLKSVIDSKETERAIILEELLMAKQKLEEGAISDENEKPVNLDRKISSSDEELDEIKEEKNNETQESLDEKKYFSDEKQNSELKIEEKSPSSFAKKLASVEQVRQFQSTLERESTSLLREKKRDEKVAANLTEQITVEAQELLKLFGIPYLIAPMEAEAQCAFLDLHGLTQGTITDDSDIWLFGANNVYKNFFDQKKFVKLFKSTDIHKVYNLGRDELIMLGLLVGSDYTSGLTGVGPVTALEIVAEFPTAQDDVFPPRDRLDRFAKAFDKNSLSTKLTKKLLSVQLIEGFPSLEVVKAYTDPHVDESKEKFSWGVPDLENIREFAMQKFGWDVNKTDKTLEPIIDKLKENKSQMTLHGFFDWAFEGVQGKMSKRVEQAVQRLGTSPTRRQEEDEDSPQEEPKEKAKRVLSQGKAAKKKKTKNSSSDEAIPSTSELNSEVLSVSKFDEAAPSTSTSQDMSVAGPSSFNPTTSPTTSTSSTKSKKSRDPMLVATLPRVNATIEKLRKGKSLKLDKPRVRKAREFVSLTKPLNELDFDAPFGSGETRKRKKVPRTDEEKWREIEEARAKAARVIAKLKKVDQFHADI